MKEPIIISKSSVTGKSVVSARELHKRLGVTKDFNQWIKAKVKKLHLTTDQNFTVLFYNKDGGRIPLTEGQKVTKIDCVLTIDAAKKISMTYKSPKSQKITQRLIAEELKNGITTAELLKLDEETQEPEVPIFEYPNLISSVEIANATGKNHQHVLRDIQEMCKQGEIVVVQNWTTIDTQEAMVIEHEREVNQGMGRVRKYKEYLLNRIAAEVLALGYDVKRRIAIVKLIEKMKIALEQKPTTIMLEARNMSVAEVAKSMNTCSHRIIQLLRKHRYVRANNRPYDKYLTLGYFAYERYNPEHSAKRLMVTSTKGMPLVQELLGKTSQLPVVRQAMPVMQEQQQQSFLPATQIDSKFFDLVNDNKVVMVAMSNYILMCKAGNGNKIEEEKYTNAIKAYHTKYGEDNPDKL